MFLVNNSKEETLNMKVSTNSPCDDSAKFQSIQNLKTYFRQSQKILMNIKLKSLLQEGGILLKSNSHNRDFLISYGTRLINYVGKDITVDMELCNQLEYILMHLQQEDESLADKLFTRACQVQNDCFFCFNGIIEMCKVTFERRVIGGIENSESLEMEFLARMSANSPKVFQSVTSILYSILVKTQGHWRVFEVIASFISSVVSVCITHGKDFLNLYPENCRRIVSLLIVSPDLYSDEIIKNEVLCLLMEMFLLDKKKILILLSHYTDWLCVFRNHLIKKQLFLRP